MLARLFGRSNIYKFRIEIFGDIKTFDFLNVEHFQDGNVLCQVTNITRDGDKLIGDCKIIGFRENRVLRNIRTPFLNDAKIEKANDKFIESTVGLNKSSDAFIGLLENHSNLKINLDLKKMITKHIAILAKSGAGKSYTVGVLLEEVIRKNIPIIILDPHNEYASLKYPNSDERDLKRLQKFKLQPQGFLDRVKEYSPDVEINPQCMPITLDLNKLKPQDLVESLPQKLSPSQQGLMFNILSNLNNKVNFDELIFNISNEESNSKWSLITLLEQLKKLKIYSSNPTPLNEIVKHRQATIISLKGVEPYVLETFVSGLLRELFEARKREEIPPFLLVLEEAHNFCPERGFGELKTSKIIRTIAGEGRKFGVGLCVISQRPAKVDKNVVSQCTTQILLKMTNPNDLKSVIASSEGVDNDSAAEIQKLNIGTCLLTGVIDIPLKVNIRPRISKHGGETVDITLSYEVDENGGTVNPNAQSGNNNMPSYGGSFDENGVETKIREQVSRSSSNNINTSVGQNAGASVGINNEFVQYVAPDVELQDAKIALGNPNVKQYLSPGVMIKMKSSSGADVNLLFDKSSKKIVKRLFPYEGVRINERVVGLSGSEKTLFETVMKLNDKFNPAELLIKSKMMFNEILRVCDALANKGILVKNGRDFEIGALKFMKKLEDNNFFGNQKFEEVNYDIKENEVISTQDVQDIFSMFGKVDNVKDIFILKYI